MVDTIMLYKKLLNISLIIILLPAISFSQKNEKEYIKLYNNGSFNSCYENVIKKLKEIYSTRVVDKRVPTGFIELGPSTDTIDMMQLFKKRKVKSFFIEDNMKISELHHYGGKCLMKLLRYREAINHYVQSLRFRKIETNRDDLLYYEMSQIFKKDKHRKAYIDSLETAYTLNPSNYKYLISPFYFQL